MTKCTGYTFSQTQTHVCNFRFMVLWSKTYKYWDYYKLKGNYCNNVVGPQFSLSTLKYHLPSAQIHVRLACLFFRMQETGVCVT